jgi:hypothetical protein
MKRASGAFGRHKLPAAAQRRSAVPICFLFISQAIYRVLNKSENIRKETWFLEMS